MKRPTSQPDELTIGERVVCLDAEASFHGLAKGALYTVSAAYDGTPIVEVNGAYFSLERFSRA